MKLYTLYCLPICKSSKKCATSYCNLSIALDKLSVKEYEAPFKGKLVVKTPLTGAAKVISTIWLEKSESQRLEVLAIIKGL